MASTEDTIQERISQEYKWGFVTDIEEESAPPGLDEGTVRFISAKKKEPEWLLDWRLQAYRNWLKMDEPRWAFVHYPTIDYQASCYYAAPKSKADAPKSLDEVDPELLATYEKLGIPLKEQEFLSGVAVDAVFDSVSVATTYKGKLEELGIIFCSFGEAVQEHPEMVKKYLGSVVPRNDNYFATTTSRRSTARSSRTARSCSSPRACVARWSCRRTSASTRRTRASSSARSSSPTRAPA